MAKDAPDLRIGIIGCGKGAVQWHLPAIRSMPGIRIVAVADSNPENLERIKECSGEACYFNDYRKMLEQSDIDAVAVITPTQHHAEMGLAALQAGKHLLMEKPLAVNLAECKNLVAEAEASACVSMLGFNFRWHRLIREARDMIRSGYIGNIQAIRSDYTHWNPGEHAPVWHTKRELGGGVLFNDGVHHFDLWRFLLDREVLKVQACSRPDAFYADSSAVVNAVLTDHVLATGLFSFGTSPNSELEIFGDKGRLYVSCYRFDGLQFFSNSVYAGSIRDRLAKFRQSLMHMRKGFPSIIHGGDFKMSFCQEWHYFAECIREKKRPECTFDDGIRAVVIALAAIDSADSGHSVRLQ